MLLLSGTWLLKGVPFGFPKGPYVVTLVTKASDVTTVSPPMLLVVPVTCFTISEGASVIYNKMSCQFA
jgi:hypothetical protein